MRMFCDGPMKKVMAHMLLTAAVLAMASVLVLTAISDDSDAAAGEITISVTDDLRYDGEQITVGTSGCDINYTSDYSVVPSVTFAVFNGTSYGEFTADHPSDPGKYTVRLTFTDDPTYDDTFKDKEFEIGKKLITVSPSGYSYPQKTFDGSVLWEPTGAFYIFEGTLPQHFGLVQLDGTFVFDDPHVKTATKVTGTDLSLYGNAQKYYQLSTESLEITGSKIVPRQLHIDPDSGQSKTFGDSDPLFTYTYGNCAQGTPTFTGSLMRQSGEDAGKYRYGQGSLRLADGVNFLASDYTIDMLEKYFRIDPKQITYGMFTADTSDIEYTGGKIVRSVTSDTVPQFTTKYFNNVLPGQASFYVESSGNYTGALMYYFTIIKKYIDVPGSLYYKETGQQIEFTDFPASEWFTETTKNPRCGTEPGIYSYHFELNPNCQWRTPYDGDYKIYITIEDRSYIDPVNGIAVRASFDDGVRTDSALSVTLVTEFDDEMKGILHGVRGSPAYEYDVDLIIGEESVPTTGMITLRILVPEDLREKDFDLYQLYGQSKQIVRYEMTDGYAVFQTDELTEYVMVDTSDEGSSILIYVIIGSIAAIALIIAIIAVRRH